MTLQIKNMVCDRCIRVVKEEFQNMGISVKAIKLGEVELPAQERVSVKLIDKRLKSHGFKLLTDRKTQHIEKIKIAIIELIHQQEEVRLSSNFSDLIQEKLNMDYKYLSASFSSMEGTTIDKFIILHRVERVKELLIYNEMSLSQIAFKMGYSSVSHLSSQFKKVTTYTPTNFKKLRGDLRNSLDTISAS